MPTPSLPRSLADLLIVFGPCFTAPTFRTFCALVTGFLAQPGRRTITGMLVGARLAGRWHHARAHRFFAAARWPPDALGLLLVDLTATRLLDRQAPLHLVVDDTLFRRSGRKVWGAAWHHDPLARGRRQVAWGNSWACWGCWFVCRSCRSGRCACRYSPDCGGPGTPIAPNCGWPARWSPWSPSATRTAACTWSPTPPTPAGRCASCPRA
jgi:DDE superfamily endonuclease